MHSPNRHGVGTSPVDIGHYDGRMEARSRWTDERIDELAREVDRQRGLGPQVERLAVAIEHLGTGVSELRSDFGQLRGDFGQLRGELGQLRGEFGQLRGEFGELRGEFGELRGEFGQLRVEVYESRRWLIGLVVTVFVGLLAIVIQLGLQG
jgi:chromosome segregation ATPase